MYGDLTRDRIKPSVFERLWKRVVVGPRDACWEWQGSRTVFGHGRIGMTDLRDGKWRAEYTHRLAFIDSRSADIPAGMVIMHTCDNPPCCNPEHLRLGTQAENCQDRERKGRRQHAQSNRALQFSDEQQRRIVELYTRGVPMADIGAEIGCSVKPVRRALCHAGVEIRPRGGGGKARAGGDAVDYRHNVRRYDR